MSFFLPEQQNSSQRLALASAPSVWKLLWTYKNGSKRNEWNPSFISGLKSSYPSIVQFEKIDILWCLFWLKTRLDFLRVCQYFTMNIILGTTSTFYHHHLLWEGSIVVFVHKGRAMMPYCYIDRIYLHWICKCTINVYYCALYIFDILFQILIISSSYRAVFYINASSSAFMWPCYYSHLSAPARVSVPKVTGSNQTNRPPDPHPQPNHKE